MNWLEERNITPYMYTREGQARQNSKLYGIDQFTYVPETGNYICPKANSSITSESILRIETMCGFPPRRDAATVRRSHSALREIIAVSASIFMKQLDSGPVIVPTLPLSNMH